MTGVKSECLRRGPFGKVRACDKLVTVMKKSFAILLAVLVSGCVTQSGFEIRDSGDKVYRGYRPSYVYMDSYFGFPYYGPYAAGGS